MTIFDYFGDISKLHDIKYINCTNDPNEAAMGFMRTQLMNREESKIRTVYEHYGVKFDSDKQAERYAKQLPDVLKRAGLSFYRAVYYIDSRIVHVIFNTVDIDGNRFGHIQEKRFREATNKTKL